jgi:hypothetical protein
MCSIPTSSYDILYNDYVHPSYMAPIDGRFDTGSGESFYPLPFDGVLAPTFPELNNVFHNHSPDGGLSPAFPTYNAVPHFQTQPLFTRTPSSSSGSSTSLEPTLAPAPNLLLGDLPRLYPGLDGNLAQLIAAPPAKSEVAVSVRRSRGPNKRPPGTGFADLMVRSFHLFLGNIKRLITRAPSQKKEKLSPEVQTALKMFYPGCCDAVNSKDNSTWQKHIFSNRHCSKLEKHLQELLPSFVCPAFIALHSQCKTAK